jgi:hypothetical protein
VVCIIIMIIIIIIIVVTNQMSLSPLVFISVHLFLTAANFMIGFWAVKFACK